jgi:hypothetical protein
LGPLPDFDVNKRHNIPLYDAVPTAEDVAADVKGVLDHLVDPRRKPASSAENHVSCRVPSAREDSKLVETASLHACANARQAST